MLKRLFFVFLILILIQTVNAQQVIQLQWVEDSGNVQYDELGPYTKIDMADEIHMVDINVHGTFVWDAGERSIVSRITTAYISWVKISLDGNIWVDPRPNMSFRFVKAYARYGGWVYVYVRPHEAGYVISQPISWDEINDENDPDVLVYKGEHISVDILDKNGNVYYRNAPSGFTLKMLPQDVFPIRIKVNLEKSAYRQKLEYAEIIENKFYGYVFDEYGNKVSGATIKLIQTDKCLSNYYRYLWLL